MPARPFILAIDGPAGAGKSTVARGAAAALGFCLVDTGAIYRAVALLADRSGIPFEEEDGVAAFVEGLDLSFELEGDRNRVFLAGEDVSEAIRTPRISMGASTVSAHPKVRAGLLDLQRRLALSTDRPGAVLEGRDIGTVVFPDADLKVFLTARPEVRARRRHAELLARGKTVSFEEVLADQSRRDEQDRGRAVAPLVPADDAVHLDASDLSAEGVIARVVDLVRAALTKGTSGS